MIGRELVEIVLVWIVRLVLAASIVATLLTILTLMVG